MQKQENNKKLEVAVIRMKELQDRRNKSAIELHDKRKLDVVYHVRQCSVFEKIKSSRNSCFCLNSSKACILSVEYIVSVGQFMILLLYCIC
jgi:hypothetical protein